MCDNHNQEIENKDQLQANLKKGGKYTATRQEEYARKHTAACDRSESMMPKQKKCFFPLTRPTIKNGPDPRL